MIISFDNVLSCIAIITFGAKIVQLLIIRRYEESNNAMKDSIDALNVRIGSFEELLQRVEEVTNTKHEELNNRLNKEISDLRVLLKGVQESDKSAHKRIDELVNHYGGM